MASLIGAAPERPVAAVPLLAKILLVVALAIHIAWMVLKPPPTAHAAALRPPPEAAWLRAASLGEAIAASQSLSLYLQAFDNQPGVSIPFRELDYGTVIQWLEAALTLDANSQYPLLMAAHLYAQVPEEHKQRQMLDYVHREFLKAPDRRWRWLAHAAIVAKHRLQDMPLALRYADDIARLAPRAMSWARQMRIFILEDMGEREAATILLGGLLASGEISDAAEIRFLTQRLEALKAAEKSSPASKSR